eukprot:CAMPEP_0116149054 /NCGR_PEP_ID=MMETSP0329-20121206/18717_1 /TAXON_ID=697910 /ORGANISM="Pseudo-nitzschia arenysensis, Strain B593" /LENGTH=241 /DNA_ID=CAMNT_0003645291 /DNA_START=37 /DNA_END=762 /DNA_ORIENTATION=-
MKAPDSIIYTLLCLSLQLKNVSAMMGFSFANLLFAVNICNVPDSSWCKVRCSGHHGPPIPPNHQYCDNVCDTDDSDSDSRKLEDSSGVVSWTRAACQSIDSSSEAYTRCMAGACTSEEALDESDLAYTAYNYTTDNDSSSFVGGTTTNGITTPIASRTSLIPLMVAASVSVMFLLLYVWRKRSKKEELLKEDLMGDDDNQSFHGSVARRIERARSKAVPLPTVIEMEGGSLPRVTTGYAMA